MLQRRSSKRPAADAVSEEARGDARVLAIHLEMVLGGQPYRPSDTEGLPGLHVAFLRALSEVVSGRSFTEERDQMLPSDRETSMLTVTTMMPAIVLALRAAPEGAPAIAAVQARVAGLTADITRDAVTQRAHSDARLAVQLASPEAHEARASTWEVLGKTQEIFNSFMSVPTAMEIDGQPKALGALGSDINDGLGLAFRLTKATDPSEYRKIAAEAHWYCEQHGVVLSAAKHVEVASDLTKLTAGTLTAVLSKLTSWGASGLSGGVSVELMRELDAVGHLIGSAQRGALTLHNVGAVLSKLEKAISVVGIVGGAAKLMTAESTFDRVDAGVDITTGTLSLAGQLTGRAALGSAATAIGLPWMGVKYLKFIGDQVGGAIEGSLFGGLHEEFGEVNEVAAELGRDLLVLGYATNERDLRFATASEADPGRAGAAEAVDDAALHVQRSMVRLANRWLGSRISALGRALPEQVQQSVEFAAQEGYPADLVGAAAGELIQALADAHQRMEEIVLSMAVDQGYVDADDVPAKLAKMKKNREKEAAIAAF
jgi:hypothetical protein